MNEILDNHFSYNSLSLSLSFSALAASLLNLTHRSFSHAFISIFSSSKLQILSIRFSINFMYLLLCLALQSMIEY